MTTLPDAPITVTSNGHERVLTNEKPRRVWLLRVLRWVARVIKAVIW